MTLTLVLVGQRVLSEKHSYVHDRGREKPLGCRRELESVSRAAHSLSLNPTGYKACVFQSLQVAAHAVRREPEGATQLAGRCRAGELEGAHHLGAGLSQQFL